MVAAPTTKWKNRHANQIKWINQGKFVLYDETRSRWSRTQRATKPLHSIEWYGWFQLFSSLFFSAPACLFFSVIVHCWYQFMERKLMLPLKSERKKLTRLKFFLSFFYWFFHFLLPLPFCYFLERGKIRKKKKRTELFTTFTWRANGRYVPITKQWQERKKVQNGCLVV